MMSNPLNMRDTLGKVVVNKKLGSRVSLQVHPNFEDNLVTKNSGPKVRKKIHQKTKTLYGSAVTQVSDSIREKYFDNIRSNELLKTTQKHK